MPVTDSIHAALKYQFSTTGVDINPRHIEVARFLAGLASTSSAFELDSAETFSRSGEFDVLLHFDTLYNLRNSLLSLQRAFENLKPCGYLGLETQVYDHPQDLNVCNFRQMETSDPTNLWPLNTPILKRISN